MISGENGVPIPCKSGRYLEKACINNIFTITRKNLVMLVHFSSQSQLCAVTLCDVTLDALLHKKEKKCIK